MALVKCNVCKTEVEETVEKCPHCESLGPKKSKRVSRIMIAVLIVITICIVWVVYNHSQSAKDITKEQVQDRKRIEKIQQRVLSASFLLKTSVSNPESVLIDKIKTNEDGSVLCYQYKIKNPDGTTKESKAVFAEGDLHYSTGSWEIYCADPALIDASELVTAE